MTAETQRPARIAAIDILRGIVMVLMALDHTRDFFSSARYSPTDIEQTNAFMFFTRWITHYCAPVFIFLSGTSAFLSLQRGKTRGQASLFLLKRGIWLILLELTLVRFGWLFNLEYTMIFVQVIWAIGWSMVFLSALLYLPLRWLAVLSLAIIAGHNLLDGIRAAQFGDNALWWNLLHEQDGGKIGNVRFFVAYPLVPWIAVMALGYCCGSIMRLEAPQRHRLLTRMGIGCMAAFVVLRLLNLYGDPTPWQEQDTLTKTILSFLNVEKYPPSLLYLLMTLGPALVALPLLERVKAAAIARFFTVFGKVPMFYYLIHIYTIHGLALLLGLAMGFPLSQFTNGFFGGESDWGFGLGGVYLAWAIVIALLYLPCRWFMQVKARRKDWWLGYL